MENDEFGTNKVKMVPCRIPKTYHDFVINNGLQFADLLRGAIRNQMDRQKGLIVDNVFEERQRADKLFKVCEELKKRCWDLQAKIDEDKN